MFGIGFNGHPDLRNMYLPTEFEGYPLRKDFPLWPRWSNHGRIVDVEPMPVIDDATTTTQSDVKRPPMRTPA